MSIIDLPRPAALTHERPRPEATAPSRSARLPRRFDVHRIDEVLDGLRRLGGDGAAVVVDGADVEMIDLAALESLEVAAEELPLAIAGASVALRATIRFTGRTGLEALLVPGHDHATAA